jgi:hypothetical protein
MNPNWIQIARQHLAVLRLPPEREIEIVEEQALRLEAAYEDALADGLSEAEAEARAMRSYDWRLLECELSRAATAAGRAGFATTVRIDRACDKECSWIPFRRRRRTIWTYRKWYASIIIWRVVTDIGETDEDCILQSRQRQGA